MPEAHILRIIRFYVPTAEFYIQQSGLESCAGVCLPQRQRIKFSYFSTLSTLLSVALLLRCTLISLHPSHYSYSLPGSNPWVTQQPVILILESLIRLSPTFVPEMKRPTFVLLTELALNSRPAPSIVSQSEAG